MRDILNNRDRSKRQTLHSILQANPEINYTTKPTMLQKIGFLDWTRTHPAGPTQGLKLTSYSLL